MCVCYIDHSCRQLKAFSQQAKFKDEAAWLTRRPEYINHGEGTDGKLDLVRTAAVIQRLKPDAVALPEIDKATTRSRGVDQAAERGNLTEMHVAFGKAMDFVGGQSGEGIQAWLMLRAELIDERRAQT